MLKLAPWSAYEQLWLPWLKAKVEHMTVVCHWTTVSAVTLLQPRLSSSLLVTHVVWK
jgi:hypothetical protein